MFLDPSRSPLVFPGDRDARANRGAVATWRRGAGAALLALALAACGSSNETPGSTGSSTTTSSAGGAGGTANTGGSSGTGGSPDAGAATAAVYTDLTLPGYPHKIDVYLPSNAERVVVFLHGGGGSKEMGAGKEIGVRLDDPPGPTPVPNTAWLTARRTAFVLPQGQAIAAAPKATTWSNWVMTSGVDDVAFLSALAGALRAGSFDEAVPKFTHVYLAGHSNGGMMTNRMWCEAPAAFDAYGALSGPASVQLAPAGMTLSTTDPLLHAHPCAPSVAKPYVGVIGEEDTILQTKGAWDQDTWSITPCLTQGGGGSILDPNLVNEQRFHDFRVTSMCGGTAAAPKTSADGATTTWSDCGGKIRLEGVTTANHCVTAGKGVCVNCTSSLESASGTAMRDVLVDFFSAQE